MKVYKKLILSVLFLTAIQISTIKTYAYDYSISEATNEFSYVYNSEGNRISKTVNGEIKNFTYDNQSKIQQETGENLNITYLYDEYEIIGFSLNGSAYYYTKDYDFNVIAITDENGIEVAKYEYDGAKNISAILGQDENGEWVDKAYDSDFIGVINKIRLHSYYYDDETGWYYDGLNFYDHILNKFLGKSDILDEVSTLGDFLQYNNLVPVNIDPRLRAVPSTTIAQITQWYNTLLSTATFGRAIDYSTGWYNSVVDVELISRLIYGENTANETDQRGVAWVIRNRVVANTFGSGYVGVAKYSGQFAPITGGEATSTHSRNPSRNSAGWKSAVWDACVLLTLSTNVQIAELMPKPTGVDTQLYFVGREYAVKKFMRQGSPYIQYYMDSSWTNITNVTIVNNLYNTTSYGAVSAITGDYNIFFNKA